MNENAQILTLAGVPHFPQHSSNEESPDFPSLAGIPRFPHFPQTKFQRLGRAEWLESLEAKKEAFEERAAILEFDAGMSRDEAEATARRITGYEGA